MASNSLKMFTLFLFVVSLTNLAYYAVYWKRLPSRQSLQMSFMDVNDVFRSKIHSNQHPSGVNKRVKPKVNKHAKKVVVLPKQRIFKKLKTAELLCGANVTNKQPIESTIADPTLTEPKNITGLSTKMPRCPDVPSLLGPTNLQQSIRLHIMNTILSHLKLGGSYTPSDCEPTENVAIIVAYRGPIKTLLLLLYSVHLFMSKQKVAYQIFVVQEYNQTNTISRGELYNIGFIEAMKVRNDTTCMVFHDPFLSPTDSNNLYRCTEQPKFLTDSIDDVPYSYWRIYDGVIAMRPLLFRKMNGFSIKYSENESGVFDELYERLVAANYTFKKPSREHAVYNNILPDEDDTTPMPKNTPSKYYSNNAVSAAKELPGGLNKVRYAVTYPIQFKLMYLHSH